MTLNEYLNQTDPQRDVTVVLNPTEYKETVTAQIADDVFTVVLIHAIAERFGIEASYIKVNDDKRLYTPDPHTGLPRNPSVFYLP